MKIKDAKVIPISDLAQLAQARIQQEQQNLDPVIAINHGLRKSGFAADTLTIENAKTDKRIMMISHDDKQDVVDYEFGLASQDPKFEFQQFPLSELTEQKIYDWILEALA